MNGPGAWGDGYVTDVAYIAGYYRQQAPMHLALGCVLGGYDADRPDPSASLVYLELGCGLGLGAMVLAAANPGWTVVGIDFNPAHVADARRVAADAGLDNVRFLEADLATLAGSAAAADVPMADVVSMHGVWSWVSDAVQQGIVRLLRDRVLPGGIVQVSYNVLPAWQGEFGLQRLVRAAGLARSVRSDRQAESGLDVARRLLDADAWNLRSASRAPALLKQLVGRPAGYLAHEFMNANWRPCFHADVAAALADAKLDWIASAHMMENFPELTLTEAQREIQQGFDDPAMRELVKDMCLERGLRQDVFVRGPRRLSAQSRAGALGGVSLMLTRPPDDFVYEFEAQTGRAALARPFYEPIVRALGGGPRTVRELLELPEQAAGNRNAAELIAVLIGTEQAIPLADPSADAGPAARRLNAINARRMLEGGTLTKPGALSSRRLGSGLPCSVAEMYLLDRIAGAGGVMDPLAYVLDLMPGAPAEVRAEAQALFATLLERRAPAWRDAGLT